MILILLEKVFRTDSCSTVSCVMVRGEVPSWHLFLKNATGLFKMKNKVVA